MVYTLGEAAKATGKSKATISKAIKTGRISALKGDDGVFKIDPSELHRVYQPTVNLPPKTLTNETEVNTNNDSRIKELEARLEAARERIQDKDSVISDLRDDRDRWRQQATALLEDKRPKGFFRTLFKR